MTIPCYKDQTTPTVDEASEALRIARIHNEIARLETETARLELETMKMRDWLATAMTVLLGKTLDEIQQLLDNSKIEE